MSDRSIVYDDKPTNGWAKENKKKSNLADLERMTETVIERINSSQTHSNV